MLFGRKLEIFKLNYFIAELCWFQMNRFLLKLILKINYTFILSLPNVTSFFNFKLYYSAWLIFTRQSFKCGWPFQKPTNFPHRFLLKSRKKLLQALNPKLIYILGKTMITSDFLQNCKEISII